DRVAGARPDRQDHRLDPLDLTVVDGGDGERDAVLPDGEGDRAVAPGQAGVVAAGSRRAVDVDVDRHGRGQGPAAAQGEDAGVLVLLGGEGSVASTHTAPTPESLSAMLTVALSGLPTV